MSVQVTNIGRCARCGEDHEGIVMSPLDNSEEFQAWAMCPLKEQPILITITVLDGSDKKQS